MGPNYILQKILLLSSPFWAICHYSDPSPWYSHPCVDPSHVVSASPIPSSRMWQQWSQVISEEGYKDTGFCLSWIACSLGSQLPCWQACMASVNSHVSELSWKWILQPWPSLQVTAAQLRVEVLLWETASQNHPDKLFFTLRNGVK